MIKFVAQHLWDPAKREADPSHSIPGEIAVELKAAGCWGHVETRALTP